MGDLPGLMPGDPQNFLSADARRRIGAAISEASLLRANVLADVETRFRSQADQSEGFYEYSRTGKPAIDLAKSFLRSARIILSADLKEYRAVGIRGLQLQEITDDLIDGACNSFELTSTQRNALREEFPGRDALNLVWAVCQRPTGPTLRQSPRLFSSKEAAETFLNEKLHTGVQNKNQGWLNPIPAVPINRTGETKRRTFQEFLPPERVAKIIPAFSIDEALDQIFEGVYPEVGCALAKEWWFAGIAHDASRRPGHHYTGVQHASVAEIILRAVYDLEDSVTAKLGMLPNAALADFFRSWQVWNYVAEFAAKAGGSGAAIQVAGHSWTAKDQATRIVDVLFEQFCVYAHELDPGVASDDATNIADETPESHLEEEGDLVARRMALLSAYKAKNGNPSHRSIYTARNSGIHKPEFLKWVKGTLPDTSITCKNFENFLRQGKPPIRKKPLQ